MSKPWQRSGFKHGNLLTWVAENRGKLVWAVLTLGRAWFAAGQPEAQTPKIGGYDGWVRTIGGILVNAGVTGFLGNLESMYEDSDVESKQWETFLLILHEYFQDKAASVASICEYLTKNRYLLESIPDSVGKIELDEKGSLRDGTKRLLGKQFRDRCDRRYGNFDVRIETAGTDSHSKAGLWRFVCTRRIKTNSADNTVTSPANLNEGVI